ncbi:MAG: TIGR00730 family Rossman fold protein, partial [Proteobacteria bacterium]|nr:TIGR00730 family Rossman fold protein [Pseudomonadota bacterium]
NRFEEKLSFLKVALKHAKGKQKKELEFTLASMKQHRKYCRYYDEAVELSRLMTEWCFKLPKDKQFRICSGGGYGIMEAANRGAFEAGGESIGLNISLPFERNPNPYITPKFNFEFHYFYMRKLWFMYYAKALVVFPGGFGTLDELFELLTLVQTGKITKPLLIVLYRESYWKNIINFNGLLEAGMISEEDLSLFTYVNNPIAAFEFLKDELPKHLV